MTRRVIISAYAVKTLRLCKDIFSTSGNKLASENYMTIPFSRLYLCFISNTEVLEYVNACLFINVSVKGQIIYLILMCVS